MLSVISLDMDSLDALSTHRCGEKAFVNLRVAGGPLLTRKEAHDQCNGGAYNYLEWGFGLLYSRAIIRSPMRINIGSYVGFCMKPETPNGLQFRV